MVFECKSSKIRIWIHQHDLVNLQKVLWEGYGDKLKVETSTNSKVKKFLDAVPYIMGLIKNIHTAAINNDLNAIIDLTKNPVPPIIFSSKDLNGLTPLHKAVGLGNMPIVQYIVSKYPESLSITDNEERTALFYSTLLKDEMNMYDYLLTSGANEYHADKKGKAAAYYKNRTIEIPQYFLRLIPDAPRTTHTNVLNSWNWNFLETKSEVTRNSNSDMNDSNFTTSQESISLGISHGSKDDINIFQNVNNNDDDNGDNDDDNVIIINESMAFGEQNDKKIKLDINLNINDDDLIELINEGNLEELANIVLSGDGEKLLNRKSENVESQEFINNVPVYMDKIHKVHQAARSGNLKEFLMALDRKKFATSCDKLSPNKATPMHVAVVFGHIKLIKYLGSKFQETLQCEDINGRTPLHYAAVVNDNKYLYNLLLGLGANSIFEDNFGNIAEFYVKNQENFSHELLLQQFKAGKSEEVMLIDKVPNDMVTFKRDLDDEATLTLLENCYKIMTYRRNLMKNLNSSSLKLLPFGNLVYKHFKRTIFDSIKKRITRLDHTLYDILWPVVKKLPKTADFRMKIEEDIYGGIFAPDQYSYKAFYEFFDPFLKDLHFINFEIELSTHSAYLTFFNDLIDNEQLKSNNLTENVTAKFNLDQYVKNIVSSTISLTRNLKEFEFPKSLSMRNLEIVEIILLDKINDRKMAQILLPYSTLNDIAENENSKRNQLGLPIFQTEEGRYLADKLGEPLIKGLTEIAYKKPNDPIAYLSNYLKKVAEQQDPLIKNSTNKMPNLSSIKDSHIFQSMEGSVLKKPKSGDSEKNIDINLAPSQEFRDEHGQTILHFTVTRSQNKNTIFQLLMDTNINVGYRDELYRTARDISVISNIPENTKEIDKYVIYLAAKDNMDKIMELLLEGYENIHEIYDEDGKSITDIIEQRTLIDMQELFSFIPILKTKLEDIHQLIRYNEIDEVIQRLSSYDQEMNRLLTICKNKYGRCSIHIAILLNKIDLVKFIVKKYPEVIHIGDNLERTALHYAMGVDNIEEISDLLINIGAKRLRKDLKGRQASYYFMNRSDILRLKEEEEYLIF